jgi:PAS domain S-box-containing protein
MKSQQSYLLEADNLFAVSLQHTLDSIIAVVCILNQEGRFVYLNKTATQVWGYTPVELMDTPFLDLVVEEEQERTKHYFTQLISGESVLHFENRCYKKDGSIVPVSWASRWDKKDNLLYCTLRDITARQDVRESEHRFQQDLKRKHKETIDVLERITDGFVAMDEDWRIIYGNAQAEKILNVKREDYLSLNYWECFPEMIDSVYYEQFHKARRENVPVHFEAYFAPFDKWFAVAAYPSDTGLSTFFRDITEQHHLEEERKQYERKLREHNQKLVDTLERIKHGFFSLDKDFRVLHWNKRAEEIIGVSKEDVIGHPLSNWYCQEAIELYRPMYEKAGRDQQPFHSEHVCPQTNRWVEISIYPSIEGFSVFFQDIDERKRTEAEMRKLSLIAKETENAVIMISLDRRATWVNAAFTRMTGFSFEEIIGKRPAELLEGPGTNPETVRYIVEEYKKKRPFQVEILNYKKSGQPFWSEIHIEPLFDAQGNIEQFFSIRKDITEKKRLEQELEDQNKKFATALITTQERERSLVSQELHDGVNQVLTTVKLYNELCLSDINGAEPLLKRSIGLLQSSIEGIRSLSKRLSAPTLGNIKLCESIKDLVETVIATDKLAILLDTDGIEELEIDQELHLTIYRILQEHLTNILKHAGANQVHITLDFVDGVLSLLVTDDGKGFDMSQKRSGIGIKNMTTRAESVNGILHIISKPGSGCVLTARFPLL